MGAVSWAPPQGERAREPSFAFAPSAAVFPDVSDKRLAALIDVHMLDTHELGAALAQMPESLDLGQHRSASTAAAIAKSPVRLSVVQQPLNSRLEEPSRVLPSRSNLRSDCIVAIFSFV